MNTFYSITAFHLILADEAALLIGKKMVRYKYSFLQLPPFCSILVALYHDQYLQYFFDKHSLDPIWADEIANAIYKKNIKPFCVR